MKLRRINKSTLPKVTTKSMVARIRFSKNGNIVFNSVCSDRMGLSVGKKVELIQNEDAPKEWFIVLSNAKEAFEITANRPNISDKQGYKICNTQLSQLFVSTNAPELTSASFIVGKEPLEEDGEMLWPIITSSYKQFLTKKSA